MTLIINNLNDIDNMIKKNEVMLLKFDKEESKYNEFINTLDFKIVNITDTEIIDFYDIDILPTILIYKNKNLIDSIEGFYTKTTLIKKIYNIIDN
jgi:hypothetical protein